MKSAVIITVLFAAIFCLTDAKPPKLPEGCYDDVTEKYYLEGERWTSNCIAHSCKKQGGIFEATYLECGLFLIPRDKDCTITKVDYTKPYPECCAKAICTEKS